TIREGIRCRRAAARRLIRRLRRVCYNEKLATQAHGDPWAFRLWSAATRRRFRTFANPVPKSQSGDQSPHSKAAHHVTGGDLAKHIFVTGGVVSSLGKGLTCASIGMLLEHRGLRVRLQKFDPYINVDPGTMSAYQHGEVYVLDDGAETDLDLGHYERFTNAQLSRDCNYT